MELMTAHRVHIAPDSRHLHIGLYPVNVENGIGRLLLYELIYGIYIVDRTAFVVHMHNADISGIAVKRIGKFIHIYSAGFVNADDDNIISLFTHRGNRFINRWMLNSGGDYSAFIMHCSERTEKSHVVALRAAAGEDEFTCVGMNIGSKPSPCGIDIPFGADGRGIGGSRVEKLFSHVFYCDIS